MVSSHHGDARMRKIFGWLGVLLALSSPAWAQNNLSVANSASASCSGIADPAARLACYDTAQPPRPPGTPPANQMPGSSRYPEFNRPPQGYVPQQNPASGNNSPSRTGKVVAAVASYSLSPSGRFTIVLDNGQTWKQIDSDDGVAQFRKEGRNAVVITKGFLWSYDLKLNAMSAVFKVTRVK